MLEGLEKYVNIDFFTLFECMNDEHIKDSDYVVVMYDKIWKFERDNTESIDIIEILDPWDDSYVIENTYDDEHDGEPYTYKVNLPNGKVFRVRDKYKYLFPDDNKFRQFIEFIKPQFKWLATLRGYEASAVSIMNAEQIYKLYSVPIKRGSSGLESSFTIIQMIEIYFQT